MCTVQLLTLFGFTLQETNRSQSAQPAGQHFGQNPSSLKASQSFSGSSTSGGIEQEQGSRLEQIRGGGFSSSSPQMMQPSSERHRSESIVDSVLDDICDALKEDEADTGISAATTAFCPDALPQVSERTTRNNKRCASLHYVFCSYLLCFNLKSSNDERNRRHNHDRRHPSLLVRRQRPHHLRQKVAIRPESDSCKAERCRTKRIALLLNPLAPK